MRALALVSKKETVVRENGGAYFCESLISPMFAFAMDKLLQFNLENSMFGNSSTYSVAFWTTSGTILRVSGG